MSYRFTKIKNAGADEKYKFEWEYINEKTGKVTEHKMACPEIARPEFAAALRKLIPHVIKLCELKEPGIEDRMDVLGVSLNYNKDDIMGVVITAKKVLDHSNSPLILNTPNKPVEPYNEKDENPDNVLSEGCVAAVEEVIEEAEAYIKEEREQTSLFNEVPQNGISTSEVSKCKMTNDEVEEEETPLHPPLTKGGTGSSKISMPESAMELVGKGKASRKVRRDEKDLKTLAKKFKKNMQDIVDTPGSGITSIAIGSKNDNEEMEYATLAEKEEKQ